MCQDRSIFLPKYFSHKSSCQISLDSITSKDWNILSKINHSFQGERKQLFCYYLFVRLSICIKHTIFVDWLLCQVFVNFSQQKSFFIRLASFGSLPNCTENWKIPEKKCNKKPNTSKHEFTHVSIQQWLYIQHFLLQIPSKT